MNDTKTIRQKVRVQKLVKKRLGDRADWGEQMSLMILIRRSRQAGRVGW